MAGEMQAEPKKAVPAIVSRQQKIEEREPSAKAFKSLLSLEERDALKKEVAELVAEVEKLAPGAKLSENARMEGSQLISLVDASAEKMESELLEVGVRLDESLAKIGEFVRTARMGRIFELHALKYDLEDQLSRSGDLNLSNLQVNFLRTQKSKIELEHMAAVEQMQPSREEQAEMDTRSSEFQARAQKEFERLKPLFKRQNELNQELYALREESDKSYTEYFKACDPLKEERVALRKELDSGAASPERQAQISKRAEALDSKISSLEAAQSKQMDGFIARAEPAETGLLELESQVKLEAARAEQEVTRISNEIYKDKEATPFQSFMELKPLEIYQQRVEQLQETVSACLVGAVALLTQFGGSEEKTKEQELKEKEKYEESKLIDPNSLKAQDGWKNAL